MAARKRTEALHPFKAESIDSVKASLREHNCLEEFNSLAAQLSEQWLVEAVLSVRWAFEFESGLQDKMNSRKLGTLLDKTRWVAREWEKQFRTPFGKAVLRFATRRDPSASELEFLRIQQRLLSLASWASDIYRGTKHSKRTLYDEALAELVESVKHKLGSYHDRQVSALVCWAIKAKSYDENTLRVWRNEHKQALSRARLKLKAH